MRTVILIFVTLLALPVTAKKKQSGSNVQYENLQNRIADLQAENSLLRHRADSLQRELSTLSELRNSVVLPIEACLTDTSMLNEINAESIMQAVKGFNEKKQLLSMFDFGPGLISDLSPKARLLSEKLKDIEEIQDARSLLGKKHTESENNAAIKAMATMSKRTDLRPADRDYCDWLSIRLEGEWAVRSKMIEMMKYFIRDWKLIPNANEAQKAKESVVINKLVKGFYPDRSDFPEEFVQLNAVLSDIIKTLDSFQTNSSRLNSEPAFKKWAQSVIDKL